MWFPTVQKNGTTNQISLTPGQKRRIVCEFWYETQRKLEPEGNEQ